jgi:Zn finger protein HypA/HybF involved in hydrogenase expression
MTVAARLVTIVGDTLTEAGAELAESARVRVGHDTCINAEALQFGFEALARGTAVAGCALEVVEVDGQELVLESVTVP